MNEVRPTDGPSLRCLRWGLRFCFIPLVFCVSWATAANDAPFNPDDPAYLRRQFVWFEAQEPARQQQLRRLHAEFVALDSEDQVRLTRVMQSYNAWLARLPESDRQRVLSAQSAAARVDLIKQLREQEWVQSLPRPYRDEYAKLDGDDRHQQVNEWRAEEADRREEWALAREHWKDNPPGRVPAIILNEGRPQVEVFVNHLRENLTEGERKNLEDARTAADEYGNYFWYLREVVRLADLHPVLPGHVGPKNFASLPDSVKESLRQQDPQFRRKGDDVRELRKAVGRWPDFAVELTRYCQKNKLTLPGPLGDCRKEQMPPEVVQFLNSVLEPQLKRSEQGKADLEALSKAQGSWPEYPRMILDLAKKYKSPIPGWTLPGPPQAWDKLRPGKNRQK
jgi:hypothetical protein